MAVTNKPQPGTESLDEEGEGARAAMKCARKRAEEIARRTGTNLIQAVDGKPVRASPPDAHRE